MSLVLTINVISSRAAGLNVIWTIGGHFAVSAAKVTGPGQIDFQKKPETAELS